MWLPGPEERRGPKRKDEYTFHYYFICWDKIVCFMINQTLNDKEQECILNLICWLQYYTLKLLSPFVSSRSGIVGNTAGLCYKVVVASVLKKFDVSALKVVGEGKQWKRGSPCSSGNRMLWRGAAGWCTASHLLDQREGQPLRFMSSLRSHSVW